MSKKQKTHFEIGPPKMLSEENQGIFMPQSEFELLIKRLLWILEPEMFYTSDPKEAAEDALNRSRLRARDLLLQVLNHLPESHSAVKEINDALIKYRLLDISVGISREAPGEFSKIKDHPAQSEILKELNQYIEDYES